MTRALTCILCAAGVALTARGALLTARRISEFTRPSKPEGLSSITWAGGDRYFATEDRPAALHELRLSLSPDGKIKSWALGRSVRLAARADLEGCAWDPLEHRIWVSDEADVSIRQFEPTNGCETASAPVPEVFRKYRVHNRTLESLTISPDGLRMYTANEDALTCDGERATRQHGACIRIQEFVRTGAGAAWRPARQFRYRTDPVGGAPFKQRAVSGVSDLVSLEDGVLLVLEREMSMKNPIFPSFRASLYALQLGSDAEPTKQLVWRENTMLANYEGICLGPKLSDGSRVLVLISDGGGEAAESVLTLLLTQKTR